MCLIVFALQAHADYRLIVAANRDEFFARPSAAAQFWTDAPDLLAGRDLQAGGTWLGVNRSGQLAAVTNVRNPGDPGDRPVSRGKLPLIYLLQQRRLAPAMQSIEAQADQYNGFNLLLGDSRQMAFLSNRGGSISSLAAGVYGLSNASLDTPWPKVTTAKQELAKILQDDWSDPDARREDLFKLLHSPHIPADHELPNTGVGLERERMLGARFIQSPDYGTRACTVILFHRDGGTDFCERQYRCQNFLGEQRFCFKSNAAV